MARIVATPVEIGPFFVGDSLPNLFIELSWDTGGAVDLGDWPNASFIVRRFKGTVTVMDGDVTGGEVVYQVTSAGELKIVWPGVFVEPGYYRLRLTLKDADNLEQSAQLLTFEIQDR
jgi:hypothetical protein